MAANVFSVLTTLMADGARPCEPAVNTHIHHTPVLAT